MENKEEIKTKEEIKKFKRIYNKAVDIIECKAFKKKDIITMVMIDTEKIEYRYKLFKEVKEQSYLKNMISFSEDKKTPITKEELFTYMPENFNIILSELKKNGNIKIHLSCTECTFTKDDKISIYYILSPFDVEILYFPRIDKDTTKLEKQIELQELAEHRKKGESVIN